MAYGNGCDADYCAECGRWTRRSVGRWCYSCYVQIVGLDRVQRPYCDPGREERIALYADRARAKQPIFEG